MYLGSLEKWRVVDKKYYYRYIYTAKYQLIGVE